MALALARLCADGKDAPEIRTRAHGRMPQRRRGMTRAAAPSHLTCITITAPRLPDIGCGTPRVLSTTHVPGHRVRARAPVRCDDQDTRRTQRIKLKCTLRSGARPPREATHGPLAIFALLASPPPPPSSRTKPRLGPRIRPRRRLRMPERRRHHASPRAPPLRDATRRAYARGGARAASGTRARVRSGWHARSPREATREARSAQPRRSDPPDLVHASSSSPLRQTAPRRPE
ncbi:hypothetical protein HYPSUDRAFT_214823 [Hypholoma sublateritium FD-334 SS-4]|uniref:Uncharacterized protein n=1 Tax=Hypholoma sublateritium (strain FD-334 SS-4) TaxID=945553 RepID=A0A0D2P5V7_HYPSF|nr:hypothetical protein HYPSUDRAFT_214823 [Hypholoma sublateritium FD-334 SS-4]